MRNPRTRLILLSIGASDFAIKYIVHAFFGLAAKPFIESISTSDSEIQHVARKLLRPTIMHITHGLSCTSHTDSLDPQLRILHVDTLVSVIVHELL